MVAEVPKISSPLNITFNSGATASSGTPIVGAMQLHAHPEQHEPQVTAVRLAPASPRVLGLLARLLLDPATDEDDTNE